MANADGRGSPMLGIVPFRGAGSCVPQIISWRQPASPKASGTPICLAPSSPPILPLTPSTRTSVQVLGQVFGATMEKLGISKRGEARATREILVPGYGNSEMEELPPPPSQLEGIGESPRGRWHLSQALKAGETQTWGTRGSPLWAKALAGKA